MNTYVHVIHLATHTPGSFPKLVQYPGHGTRRMESNKGNIGSKTGFETILLPTLGSCPNPLG